MREVLFPVLMFIAIMLWACADNFHYKEDKPGIIAVSMGMGLYYNLDAENKICFITTPAGTTSISSEKCLELIKKYGRVEQ